MNKIDIVVCVALKDCYFLRKNIPFMRLNLHPLHIYIITDKRNFQYLKNLGSDIILIDEDKLLPTLNMHAVKLTMDKHFEEKAYGWYFQQFLKMGFAVSDYAKNNYLIWDSDTVPLNPISFIEDNKYLFMPKTEHHKAYFDTIDKLLKVPIKADFSFIAEHMIIDVEIMRDLINKIDKCSFYGCNEADEWFAKCLLAVNSKNGLGFSEFETYGTFLLNYYPERIEIRKFRTYRGGSKIYGIFANRNEIDSLKNEFDTVSFEFYDYPLSIYRSVKQFLFRWFCRALFKVRVKYKLFPF